MVKKFLTLWLILAWVFIPLVFASSTGEWGWCSKRLGNIEYKTWCWIETPSNEEEEEEEETNWEQEICIPAKELHTISLYDLAVLQMAAHDFFNVNREDGVDVENQKLDLSTMFNYGEENISLGGEGRNRENIILFSLGRLYGIRYETYRQQGLSEEEAKEKLVEYFHADIKKAYKNAFGHSLPTSVSTDTMTMTHDLALRTVHDFLPGTISLDNKNVSPVDATLQGSYLSLVELKSQRSAALDGDFDPVFRNVTIFIPPSTVLHIDLFERDSTFAEQFNTEYTFEHFMYEAHDGFDETDKVYQYLEEIFSYGIES
ncbi:hypothetical protein H6501_03150 [Candidatus Woesearchaeota archaeon]|nr:hypothetical protein [Nanoarchaeota archaeon]MCB9370567.1 hypothetical protein [Candidatus Woesearchaeota archaeon]USN43649.1 MAG: hypothetical protein H6500_04635 [Candidatus Woesearchaeota archaeon]